MFSNIHEDEFVKTCKTCAKIYPGVCRGKNGTKRSEKPVFGSLKSKRSEKKREKEIIVAEFLQQKTSQCTRVLKLYNTRQIQ